MIIQASVADDILHVVSSGFQHLDIPLQDIPALAGRDPAERSKLETDEDGAFIHWPTLDVHLGWEQLQQLNNPALSLPAKQRTNDFNVRYGKAVRVMTENAGLKSIPGLTDAQLHLIQTGECRMTSEAINALAKAHQVSPNEYLRLLADAVGR